MYIIVIICIGIIGFAGYVRFAPTDSAQWHQSIEASADQSMGRGAIRVLSAERAGFEQVDRAMRALPRTEVLAGSPEDGLITYVTRSQLWGFPDYTTVQFSEGTLKLFARLRFGASDLGVNAARLTDVLATLE